MQKDLGPDERCLEEDFDRAKSIIKLSRKGTLSSRPWDCENESESRRRVFLNKSSTHERKNLGSPQTHNEEQLHDLN